MKKYSILIALAFFGLVANAQQDPQFSQNMFNSLAINPGYAGSNSAISATALHRSQFIGFKDAPTTMNLGVEGTLPMLHGGMGLNVTTDKLGKNEFLGLNLSYAYRVELAGGDLGIGLSVGMLQDGISGEYTPEAPGDASIPGVDKGSGFDFGGGLYYTSEKIYMGVSSTHINEPLVASSEDLLQVERHYYLTAGYIHELSPLLVLMPSVFVKSDGVSASFDASALLEYNNRFWGGVSLRSSEASMAVALLGMKLNENLKFGVAYDVPVSAVSGVGTMEFMVNYSFVIDYSKVVKGFKNPRLL